MHRSQILDNATIAVLGSARASNIIRSAGFNALEIEAPEDLSSLRRGALPRVLVLGGGRLSSSRIQEIVQRARSTAPLIDVLAWKPEASGDWVRTALKAGARDVLLDKDGAALKEALQQILSDQRLLPEVERISRAQFQSGRFEGLLSRNQAMWEIFATIDRVAESTASILIIGETGTGKERIARAIHRRSKREGRFVAVNCSAIRPELVQSELFGHEKGAFTGADQQELGLFRHADGGTLLLDEIGDMPPDAQLSLLRVLQENRVRPVGATREVPINVRVLAATNSRLEESIKEGSFREDLYYRLDVLRMEIPALRDRKEDILYLFGHFLRTFCKRHGVERPQIPQRTIDRLLEYPWPGNVRQLENSVERIVLEGRSDSLNLKDLNRILPKLTPPAATKQRAETESAAPLRIEPTRTLAENVEPALEQMERQYLAAVLKETGGAVGEAARIAGISRRTMTRKMQRHDLDPQEFRQPES